MKKMQVEVGSEILIQFDDGFRNKYKLVNPYEANISANKVTTDSPLGKAVLGRELHEKIIYLNPCQKKISCKIIQIN